MGGNAPERNDSERVIRALGRAGSEKTMELLTKFAHEPEPPDQAGGLRVRYVVAQAPGLAANEKAVSLLAKLLKAEKVLLRTPAQAG